MLSIDSVVSDEDTCFSEEMRVNFDALDLFASRGSALSLTVGPETGAKTKMFTTTVTHCPPVNMAGISTYLMHPALGERNSVDTAPTDTSIALNPHAYKLINSVNTAPTDNTIASTPRSYKLIDTEGDNADTELDDRRSYTCLLR